MVRTSPPRPIGAPEVPGPGNPEPDEPSAGPVLSRRKVFGTAAAAAALGVSGAPVLAAVLAPRAAAQTVTEPGAVAPTVVTLNDAPEIAVDASTGNDFRVTIAASRILENPYNAVDGQKIIFQITQGPAGGSTITWGDAYEFSTGLPAPTLSTAPGATDLLAFIYNEARGAWLFAAYMPGFAPPAPAETNGIYRLFPTTNGPSVPASYGGPFVAGVMFEVTTGGTWLAGYWWWVCNISQQTSAQTFALWAAYGIGAGTLVAAATVTSGTLVAGQWNYVELPVPVPLSPGATYIASTGLNGDFPVTNNQFGSGQPYGAGIVNGPLTAFSDLSGSLPSPLGISQGLFSVSGSDPTTNLPAEGYDSANMWMDVSIIVANPQATSYRLWPNYPTLPGQGTSSDMLAYTLACEFTLSAPCTLDSIWFYSGAGAAALPTRCGIWDVTTQTEVAGTDNTSPVWSGAAGSGWVSCTYGSVVLPAGDYKVAVFFSGGSTWFKATTGYWSSGGPGAAGISFGPLTAPGTSSATAPGQSTYNYGSWAYPATDGGGENYWVDVQVMPS